MKRISTPSGRLVAFTLSVLVGLSNSNSASAQCQFPQSVYFQSFGNGARPAVSPMTVGQVPFLDYQAPPANMNPEKIYTITPTSDLHAPSSDWHVVNDNTTGNGTGRMMLINDREPTGVVFQDIIPQGQIGDAQVGFISYSLMNILKPGICVSPGNNPDIFMNILVQYERPAGVWNTLVVSPITQYTSTVEPTWFTQGAEFVTPTSASGSFLNLRFQINNNSVVLCGNDFVIDDIRVTTCANNIILPLDLINFKGHRTGSAIQLNWNTANEDNVSHFEVERSSNGNTFTQLKSLNAAGVGANVYGVTDVQPLSGRNYYRLKIIDYDGKYKYSQVVSLNYDVKGSKVLVFPNPASSQANIELPQEWKAGAEVTLFNMNGQQVIKRSFQNASVIALQLDGVSKGIYMLKVKQINGEGSVMQKLTVSK